VFLAWAIRLLALALTPLLRRFFCSAELALGGLPLLPLRFSPLAAVSVVLMGVGEVRSRFWSAAGASLSGDGDLRPALSFWLLLESELELVSDFELPNILFSRPPCEERLRRLLPARLVDYCWRIVGEGMARACVMRRQREKGGIKAVCLTEEVGGDVCWLVM